MARRSTKIQELREKNELSCMWGLFSIIESCEGHSHRKLISNGRRVNKHIIDYPRKLNRLASFDEECRKIQNEAGPRSVARGKSVGNFIEEDMPIDKKKSEENIVKRRQQANMDAELDRIVKTQKRERKSSGRANRSSLHCLNYDSRLIHHLPSTSVEKSSDKLTLAAILEAVCAQNHQEESKLSENFERSNLGKYDQMRAKAFIDQMFIERKLICKEGTASLSKSFSNALKVLNSSNPSQTEKETVLDCNFSECEGLEASNAAEPRSAFSMQKGNINKNLMQKSDKIVILKPVPQNAKLSENVLCHCSSLNYHSKSGRKVSDAKTSSFSFREMKRKLKHTFGGTSDKLSDDRSALRVACLIDSARKKLDFSSVGLSKKQYFDVILEAKRHLSARLNNLKSVEVVTSKSSPKTLGRILSLPELDFESISPKRESQYCSGSAQMGFSPYSISPRANESSSQMVNVKERACVSPLRSNAEVTSCDDGNKHDDTFQTIDATTCSLISSADKEARDIDISTPEEAPNEKRNKEIKSQYDSLSENEVISYTIDDFPSTPSSIYQLETADITKYQEHQSPVSVLEPFFIEDADCPPSITLQNAKKQLQPRCLHFEECLFESTPKDPSINANSYTEEKDHLSQYVQLVLQASCLNWEQLSQIRFPLEEVLHASLFDEVEFPTVDCCYDPKLLFDHINEVLLDIYESHLRYPPWVAVVKPRIGYVSLVEVVLDEIMRESEFYLLPVTDGRTLYQLVSKDVAKCRSWLDVRLDTDQVVVEISEDVLEESILDIVLEFCMLGLC